MQGMEKKDVFKSQEEAWHHWGRMEGQDAGKELAPQSL